MGNLDLLNELMNKSVPNTRYKINEVSDKRFYYENKYAKPIETYYKLTYRKSNEFEMFGTSKGYDCYKICSVASSARLCYLFLANDMNIRFEWHLLNATSKKEVWENPNKNDAQLDAFDFRTYYECKCQEIFEYRTPLSISYAKYLEQYFGITNLPRRERNIIATMKEFHLGNSDKNYLHTYFDIKQLFTHLCAIIKDNKQLEDRKLQYIFFTPKENLIKGSALEDAYQELINEAEEIKNSEVIKIAKETYHIDFDYELVPIDDKRMASDPDEPLGKLEEAFCNN